ncbi:DUF636 domain protein [Dendrothele bispora CBS 962.96]|uniref:DUF636 domain protein n=1 Tax=Dendrothele bispora (strain CBS 962.96) TaxID=1314807 RepID=A0A4S8LCQ5_DENBC|nr:DUF636 domain protein [Dendrothele bispora CBS 962.96]
MRSCYCRQIEYELSLSSLDDARTPLGGGHHFSPPVYQKAFGTSYGLTAKVPLDSFKLTRGDRKSHIADNGSRTSLHPEFHDNCGSFILEFDEPVQDKFRYICVGTLDDPEASPPKGEFFCEQRMNWMPEIPGR